MAVFPNNAFKPENADGGPLVKTEGGQVRGRIATSFTGRRYASFQGIPYASPPVRNLRFKLLWHVSLLLAGRCYQRLCAPQAPQAAEPWQGVLNASAPGHGCPQLDHRSGCVVGHEDCLTLNVYTTQLEGKPQPVLVWIHGGSFANGSSRLYQPDVLLDQQLVVVTVNYRLGALGFLCWPRAGVPGNMGLRDQSLALQWVRRNIAAFGGDAGCVTLAGQSAGAASVIFHMLSPLSKGLFDRALCMSGSALCSWATPPHPEQRALRLLRAAGLPAHLNPGAGSDAAAVAAFLAGPGAAPDVLVPRYYDALDPQEPVEPMLPVLAACVETEAEACVGAFLPDAPSRLLAAGRVHRVPLLAGLTDGEANFLLLSRAQLLADLHMVEPVERTLRALAAHSPPPVFLYLLSHQPRHSFWGTPLHLINSLGVPGVPHGEDLAALFPLLPGEPPAGQRVPEDDSVRLYFATAVANFARTGNPAPKTNELMKEEWLPFKLEDQAFMNISSVPKMQRNIMAGRIQFWRELLADLEMKRNKEISQKQPNHAAAALPMQSSCSFGGIIKDISNSQRNQFPNVK
ncbi:esterase E4-like [Schistocerca serialis cubense]|uniref:esterase E4-like n=1 Tax=Schistocerca serialis cubense TaxID=2023355 RepID=UPI00214DF3DA|nr:esterase E4-like [Schistocerca serialis cubense]